MSALHGWPPTGGSHGKPDRTAGIPRGARRRGGVAARSVGESRRRSETQNIEELDEQPHVMFGLMASY